MVKKIETEKEKSKMKKTFIFHAIFTIIFLLYIVKLFNIEEKIILIPILVVFFLLYLQSPINLLILSSGLSIFLAYISLMNYLENEPNETEIIVGMIIILLYIAPSFALYFGNIKGYKLYPIKDILKS